MCYIENEEEQLVMNTLHITNAIISNLSRFPHIQYIRSLISQDVSYLLYKRYSIYRTMDIISKAIKYKENRWLI